MSLTYGFVRRQETVNHLEPEVRQLAGQPVAILADTCGWVDKQKYVDVMPCHIPDANPVTIRVGLLVCNQPPSEMPAEGDTIERFYKRTEKKRPLKFSLAPSA